MNTQLGTAILTGVFAFAGVIVAQATSMVISHINRRHKKHVLLREKYEELTERFFRFSDEYDTMQSSLPRDLSTRQTTTPTAIKIKSICHIYFPELSESASSMFDANLAVHLELMKLSLESPKDPPTLKLLSSEEGNKLHRTYRNAESEFEEKLFSKTFKSRYTKA